MKYCKIILFTAFLIGLAGICFSQKSNRKTKGEVPVIIKNGVIYWAETGKEVALFGTNYTAPFAYSYRAIAKAGISHEEAIKQDVYHFARLGFDAFRVHVWDTEISDLEGNLLNNEHLRLFDFLLAELKKYQIKSIITPIAFWGNGYPEPDTNTPGFSRYFGKGKVTINDTAIRAQENYLRQFFNHVNPYTGLTYQQDTDIIATEINNEPNHSGLQTEVTGYINRLYDAIRSTGWPKPIFYNISESPRYARAATASKADGYSFQWYPSGLVSGSTLQNNYLPHVDAYRIPFGDSLPAFHTKPLMVYEFDPADIMNPIMYPAMARSFRVAGFQWATQFAYDPMAIAHANTEYQTHFLNLAYTPAKAISMLIAGEVFRSVPRRAIMAAYPTDSIFSPFLISYRRLLSEMNSAEKFYYTNHTTTLPENTSTLAHIAGVGHSPVVQYSGTGAYFLDKLADGVWRLEVMPDAIFVQDPYEKAAPAKTVSAIRYQNHMMQISLPSLGNHFGIKGLNQGNAFEDRVKADSFNITPGTYLLTAPGKTFAGNMAGKLPLNAFVAPEESPVDLHIFHNPPAIMFSNTPAPIQATILGAENAKVSLLVSKTGWGRPAVIPMTAKDVYLYEAQIPQEMVTPGIVQYRILVQRGETYVTFPGNLKGNPFLWDYIAGGNWDLRVNHPGADVTLFDPALHKNPQVFPSWGRGIQQGITTTATGTIAWQYDTNQWPENGVIGMQRTLPTHSNLFADGENYGKIILKAKSLKAEFVKCRIILINKDGFAFAAPVELTGQSKEITIPLSAFKPYRHLLLPRPYPGFLPLWFEASGVQRGLKPADTDLIQFVVEKEDNKKINETGVGFEIEWIRLSR